jgi:hypothetical protein
MQSTHLTINNGIKMVHHLINFLKNQIHNIISIKLGFLYSFFFNLIFHKVNDINNLNSANL